VTRSPESPTPTRETAQPDYTTRLLAARTVWWKRLLHVQAPYRWNLRRLNPGVTLDIGCGVGRNLAYLDERSVGVDHNPTSVAACRALGLTAYLPEELAVSAFGVGRQFDSLLLAHVVEHMTRADAAALIRAYLPRLKARGRIILITPQEAGYASDPTHVELFDLEALSGILAELSCSVERAYSFPLPRWLGTVFPHNELVVVGRAPSALESPQPASHS